MGTDTATKDKTMKLNQLAIIAIAALATGAPVLAKDVTAGSEKAVGDKLGGGDKGVVVGPSGNGC
jgi:hypothetical protein